MSSATGFRVQERRRGPCVAVGRPPFEVNETPQHGQFRYPSAELASEFGQIVKRLAPRPTSPVALWQTCDRVALARRARVHNAASSPQRVAAAHIGRRRARHSDSSETGNRSWERPRLPPLGRCELLLSFESRPPRLEQGSQHPAGSELTAARSRCHGNPGPNRNGRCSRASVAIMLTWTRRWTLIASPDTQGERGGAYRG
jgi:hypothetical protein